MGGPYRKNRYESNDSESNGEKMAVGGWSGGRGEEVMKKEGGRGITGGAVVLRYQLIGAVGTSLDATDGAPLSASLRPVRWRMERLRASVLVVVVVVVVLLLLLLLLLLLGAEPTVD